MSVVVAAQVSGLPAHSNQFWALFVSVRKWLTPKGVQIDKVGITPDIAVTPGPYDPGYQAANDIQLQRAIEYLHGQTTGAQATPSGAAR